MDSYLVLMLVRVKAESPQDAERDTGKGEVVYVEAYPDNKTMELSIRSRPRVRIRESSEAREPITTGTAGKGGKPVRGAGK